MAIAASVGAAASARADDTAEKRARAAALLDEGVTHYTSGDYPGAYERFASAYAAYPSPKILLNVGQALRQLGRDDEAAQAYDRFLRDTAMLPEVGEQNLAAARSALADLRPRLGRIKVTVRPGDATISLDGRAVGSAADVRTLYAKPGDHRIGAEARGFGVREESVTAVAGTEVALDIVIADAPGERPTGAPPPVYKRWPFWAVVGAVVLGAVVVGVAASSSSGPNIPATDYGTMRF